MNTDDTTTARTITIRGKAAIYRRPHTQDVQTIDAQCDTLTALAQQYGFTDIVVFAERYIPGNTPLITRDGFQQMKQYIEAGAAADDAPVTAILVSSPDRLFRSSHMVEDIALFIDFCASHTVTVITPAATYDFHNHTDVVRFCFTAMAASETVATVITGRLQAGRRHARAKRAATN